MDLASEILSDTIAYMKYAKWLPGELRKETWEEVCHRNMNMHINKYAKNENLVEEIRDVYNNFVIPKKVLPSMRSMQYAGKSIELDPNRIYNCAYMPVDDMACFHEAMFLLLGGTGVGYSVQRHHVSKLPEIRKPNPNRTRKIVIEDSIMGWAEAIRKLFESYTGVLTQTPRFIYDGIRPKGSRLKTSGGKAPGPAPLRKCMVIIEGILQDMQNGDKLSTLQCHDIMCHIAESVVSGGNRRSALISLFSADDLEMIQSKLGEFERTNPQRYMANNSAVILRNKITRDYFKKLWNRIEMGGKGEPGIYFSHDKDWGTNPCCEIALRPYQFCNLTEINASTIKNQKDFEDRVVAATFLGTLQASYTDFHYLRDIWKTTTERDALLGVSMTGLSSNTLESLDIQHAVNIAKEENVRISNILGINTAARLTAIKPSGTASMVLGTSSGIHPWWNDYYIRRIRVKKNETIYKYLHEWHPELVVQDNEVLDGGIIEIPQKAPKGAITRHTEDTLSFLDRLRNLNIRWIQPGHTDGANTHNISATVYIKDNEWDLIGEWMWLNRHNYNGLAVLPHDGKSYNQPPNEDCSKQTYDKMMETLVKVDLSNIIELEDDSNFGQDPACAGGSCEI